MSDQPKGGTTTAIGRTIVIRGKLRSDEDLVVKGRIEAEITSSKGLHIESSGVVKANVSVQSARISGTVVGNVTAAAKIEIAPDGRVVGDLLAPRIVISEGAAFRGRIDMQNFDEPRQAAYPELAGSAGVAASPTDYAVSEPGGGAALSAAAGGEAEDGEPKGKRKRV